MVHFDVSSLAESVNWSSDSGVSMRECDMVVNNGKQSYQEVDDDPGSSLPIVQSSLY
jgi:hypothetical protein